MNYWKNKVNICACKKKTSKNFVQYFCFVAVGDVWRKGERDGGVFSGIINSKLCGKRMSSAVFFSF